MKRNYIQFYKILILALIFCSVVSVKGANIAVTSTSDSGVGTLRDAISLANSGDTITFDAGTNGIPILLSTEINVVKSLTFIGNDSTNTIISGNNTTRIFLVNDTASFSGIRFQEGYYPSNNFITGAAIGVLQNGVIQVEACDFIDNEASYGAAIHCYFGGDAYVNNSRFYRNTGLGTSTNAGGAVSVTIGTNSTLQIENSIFEQNTYFQNDGNGRAGAAIYVFGGDVTLRNCDFNDNQTIAQSNYSALGGAIHYRGFLSFVVTSTIEGCTFTNNGCSSNTFARPAQGGAIYARDRVTLSVTKSRFENNSVVADTALTAGGAIYAQVDSVFIEDSYFNSNIAQTNGGFNPAQAGAVYYSSKRSTLNRCTFERNRAISAEQGANGGAIFVASLDTFRVTNSTFFKNRASGGTSSFGGAIRDFSTRSYYINNTIVDNQSDSSATGFSSTGGGIGFYRSFSERNLHNNIIANNRAFQGIDVQWGTPSTFNISQNIVMSVLPSPLAFAFTSDPNMDTVLTMNGGLVPTLAIKDTSSIAVNAADSLFAPLLDQRGASRDGRADIGAYEFNGCISTFESITPSHCGVSYILPSGSVVNTSGLFMDTIMNAGGCDSIITIDLTLLNHTTSSISPVVCNSYTSPSGTMYTMSGNFMDTIPNAVGCDSVITINLSILNSTTTSVSPTACDSYTAPSGQVFTISGNYTDTVSNVAGCDSIVTINLTVNNTLRDTIAVTACDSYTWMSNNVTYTTSGTYSDTTTAQTGCDSISTLQLTISKVLLDSLTIDTALLCNGDSDGGITVHVGSNVIFSENFDSFPFDNVSFAPGAEPNPFPNGWNNVQSDVANQDWYGRNIGTGSSNTGPSADHTSGTGNYVFVEDGFGNNTDVSLETPQIDLSGQTAATFNYWAHSRNNSAGENEMHLDVFHNGAWVLNIDSFGVLSTTDLWIERNINVSAYTGGLVTFRFRVDNSNTSFPHDIAIDDVSITTPVTYSYVWSNGNTTNSLTGLSAGNYTVTITNSNGCTAVDSVLLTEPSALSSSFSDTACVSYTWAQNGTIYTMSGNYADTVTSNIGCDSILNLNLTILNSSSATVSPVVCGSYTAPSGVVFTMSGNYADTLVNAVGCDSVISINLTVNNSTTSSISPVVCGSYTAPSGMVYTINGNYADTLVNAVGCDSIISINLTVNNSTSSSISPVVCGSYTAPSGMVYTISGNYADTLVNAVGCDSIISINLTVNNSTSSSISPVVCGSYTAPSGMIFTTTGNYNDTIANNLGCDSIISINLTVDTVNNAVTQNGFTLTTSQSGATYQWLDCNNANAQIAGETGQAFTATANGSYAVEVTLGSCVDTSACNIIIGVGLEDRIEEELTYQLYPNPAANQVTIEVPSELVGQELVIYNLNGKLLQTITITQEKQILKTTTLANGLYLVRYQNSVKRLVITR